MQNQYSSLSDYEFFQYIDYTYNGQEKTTEHIKTKMPAFQKWRNHEPMHPGELLSLFKILFHWEILTASLQS